MLLKHLQRRQTMRPKLYRKAPHKFALYQSGRLRGLARWSLFLAIVFAILSNPFAAYELLMSAPKRVTSFAQTQRQNWPKYLAQVQDYWKQLPTVLSGLPKQAEATTFAAFDWTKAQLDGARLVFAKEARNQDAAKEAGQSASVSPSATPTVDPATLSFRIQIPKLAVDEQVKANVNPNDAKEYTLALEEGVAHAKGSAFPGENKLVYIFGHSTDGSWNVEAYNAVFYQIKELVVGDEIVLQWGEQRFSYKVKEQKILKGSDVDYINGLQDENLLLLQTCWPPGTTWQRLFVVAEPVENS